MSKRPTHEPSRIDVKLPKGGVPRSVRRARARQDAADSRRAERAQPETTRQHGRKRL